MTMTKRMHKLQNSQGIYSIMPHTKTMSSTKATVSSNIASKMSAIVNDRLKLRSTKWSEIGQGRKGKVIEIEEINAFKSCNSLKKTRKHASLDICLWIG